MYFMSGVKPPCATLSRYAVSLYPALEVWRNSIHLCQFLPSLLQNVVLEANDCLKHVSIDPIAWLSFNINDIGSVSPMSVNCC